MLIMLITYLNLQDNFAKGVYPTLAERSEFISNASDYVTDKINSAQNENQTDHIALVPIISFSFVNTDLRVEFRKRFPDSEWVLVDTSKELAEERILSREDHFYKGSGGSTHEESDPTTTQTVESGDTDDKDNSEWEFKPVDFPHVVLDGNDEVTTNAQKIVDVIQIQLLNRK